MNKLKDFFQKTMFYARVLSGYEERKIRSYRLQLQQRLQQAEARKSALNKLPEQIILSEVQKMVQDMQAMNKKLDETEAAIEEYFKPIDKEAEMLMKAQLDGEEKTMRMMAEMQREALLEKAKAEAELSNSKNAQTDQHVEEPEDVDKKAKMG